VTKTAAAAKGKAGSLSVGSGASPVKLSWPKSGLAATPPTLKSGLVRPSGAAVAISIVARTKSGHPVTRFAHPLDIAFSGAPGGVVPAFSHDGKSWSRITRLPGSTLLPGLADGYYKDSLGAVHILTLHATVFALLEPAAGKSAASERLALGASLPARLNLARTHDVPLTVVSTRAGTLTASLVTGGKPLKTWRKRLKAGPTAITLALPARAQAGSYSVRLQARAGGSTVTRVAALRLAAPAA
jgi:hypothetical protein